MEKMYFYCPECKTEDKEFKFKNDKERYLLKTWINVRDGFGQSIEHIKCPKCGNVLSGIIRYRNSDWDIKEQQEYFKDIIEMYNKEFKEGGYVTDGKLKELKEQLQKNYELKLEKIKCRNI